MKHYSYNKKQSKWDWACGLYLAIPNLWNFFPEHIINTKQHAKVMAMLITKELHMIDLNIHDTLIGTTQHNSVHLYLKL